MYMEMASEHFVRITVYLLKRRFLGAGGTFRMVH